MSIFASGKYSEERRICRQEGFTLIELLVVMVILGLLVGLIGLNVFKRLGESKQKAARVQIAMMGDALDAFRLDVGRYPTTDEGLEALYKNPGITGWNGPYLQKDVPLDPWGKPYIYRCPGEHGDYDLESLGADGQEGGTGENADVTSWQ
ncbi:MAG: type II secretion system major pseudopilin GspG, partial [Syntrophobacteraceae bacterium]